MSELMNAFATLGSGILILLLLLVAVAVGWFLKLLSKDREGKPKPYFWLKLAFVIMLAPILLGLLAAAAHGATLTPIPTSLHLQAGGPNWQELERERAYQRCLQQEAWLGAGAATWACDVIIGIEYPTWFTPCSPDNRCDTWIDPGPPPDPEPPSPPESACPRCDPELPD